MESEARNRGWWSRNWKWAVPGGVLVLVLLLAAAPVMLFMLISGQVKSSEVYVEALSAARSDADLTEDIGKPIEDGLFPGGSFQISGPSGYAEISIPISGPRGSATVYGVAEKSIGEWSFTDLIVEVEGSGHRINLLDETEMEKSA